MTSLSLTYIADGKHLRAAFDSVLSKGSSGGIDNVSIEEYKKSLDKNIRQLSSKLMGGTWKPQPYMGINVPKKSGGVRQLGLLSVEDKIVQTSIKFALEPVVEKRLHSSSYAYRSGRGHVKAVRRALHESRQKVNRVYLRIDIKDFFDSVNRDILTGLLADAIQDKRLLSLIRLCMTMGRVNQDMSWQEFPTGIPQGAILSPLLSNLYLTSFDVFVCGMTNSYIRYADDCVCWFKNEADAQTALDAMKRFLQERLSLRLNEKVKIGKVDENPMTYLGLEFFQGQISITDSKKQELAQCINNIRVEGGVLARSYIKSLDGIRQYYAKVLPDEFSILFDMWLKDAIKAYIKKNKSRKEAYAIFGAIDGYVEKDSIRSWIREAIKEVSASVAERKAIASRKREYQRREAENSELVINTPGCFLGLSGRGITLRKNGQPIKIPPTAALKHITIMSQGVSLSSNLIDHCMANDIAIDFFDLGTKHIGSILTPKYMTTSLWKKQASLDDSRSNEIGKRIIIGKVKNQSSLAKYFNKYHKTVGVSDAFLLYDDSVQTLLLKIKDLKSDNPDFKHTLMGLEASAASAYWEYVRALVEDDDVGFYARVKQGATDLVNSLLNYGYAILYPRIWQAALRHKLNPYIGFVHYADGQANLVFDMIELFRSQGVDRVVIALIQKKEELKLSKGRLDEPTKAKLAKHIIERFNRRETYRGESRRFLDIIDLQFNELCKSITDGDTFRPYLAKW